MKNLQPENFVLFHKTIVNRISNSIPKLNWFFPSSISSFLYGKLLSKTHHLPPTPNSTTRKKVSLGVGAWCYCLCTVINKTFFCIFECQFSIRVEVCFMRPGQSFGSSGFGPMLFRAWIVLTVPKPSTTHARTPCRVYTTDIFGGFVGDCGCVLKLAWSSMIGIWTAMFSKWLIIFLRTALSNQTCLALQITKFHFFFFSRKGFSLKNK